MVFRIFESQMPINMKRFSHSLIVRKMILEYYFIPGYFSLGTIDILNLIILSCALGKAACLVSIHYK